MSDEISFLLTEKNNLPNEDTPILDFKGVEGVAERERERWKSAGSRLEYGSINLTAKPRSENTLMFLKGEPGVNNPLNLIRPFRLLSVKSYLEANGTYDYLKYKEGGNNNWELDEKEKNYLNLIKKFEEVAVAVLESVDLLEIDERISHVQSVLFKVFGSDGLGLKEISKTESPQSWLLYSVLSVLDNPSKEITPAGRLRVLELLTMYPAKDIALGFIRDGENNGRKTGYDKASTPRLPYTFCSKEERLQKSHADIWLGNKEIKDLISRDSSSRVDWRVTSTEITMKNPEEAVQIALLLLHNVNLVEGGIGFLQSIPKLEQKTLSRMFGPKATFIVEHRIAEGWDVEKVIAEGMGVVRGVRTVEEENYDPQELVQELRRERMRREDAEDNMTRANVEVARLRWEKTQSDLREKELMGELEFWRTGKTPVKNDEQSSILVNKMDPKGYYRTLGLHPSFFVGLSDIQVEELLRNHYRVFAVANTQDKNSGGTERMYQINEAYTFLSKRENRKTYGN